MRSTVQTLRDRLKSGLLGWSENIRLQYDHLASCLREQQRASAIGGRQLANQQLQQQTLTPAQIQSLTEVLKAEGSEIDSLVKAVEKFSLVSSANSFQWLNH